MTPRPRRRGFLAAALVVVLFMLVLLAGVFLRIVWVRQSDLRAAERRLQAEWLAESALDRALARLAIDPAYRGETWSVPADQLGGRDAGAVLIEVRPDPSHHDRRVLHVRADYPTAEARRARQSRELTLPAPPPTDRPNVERQGDDR